MLDTCTFVHEITDKLIDGLNAINPDYAPEMRAEYARGHSNPKYVNFLPGAVRGRGKEIRIAIDVHVTQSKRAEVYLHIQTILPGSEYLRIRRISTAGHLIYTVGDVTVVIVLKATNRCVGGSLTVKETLPIMMHQMGIVSLFPHASESNGFDASDPRNMQSFVDYVMANFPAYLVGETDENRTHLLGWFSSIPRGAARKRRKRDQMNDAFTQAKMLLPWKDYRVSRTEGIYGDTRIDLANRLCIRADKATPADFFLLSPAYTDDEITAMFDAAKTVEDYKRLFVSPDNPDAPVVGISLKDADANGGKGRAKVTSTSPDPERDCCLDRDETAYTLEHIRDLEMIEYLRGEVRRLMSHVNSLPNDIEYIYNVKGFADEEQITGKYAALKMFRYIVNLDLIGYGGSKSMLSEIINYALGTTDQSMPHYVAVGSQKKINFAVPFVQTDNRIVVYDIHTYGGLKVILRGSLHGKQKDIPIVLRRNGNKNVVVEVGQIYFRGKGTGAWQNTGFDRATS